MQKKQTVAALAVLSIVSGLGGPAYAQYYGQTVVVGGEASQNNVDADYEVLEMLGPQRGAPAQQQYAPQQPYQAQPYQPYQPQAVQQYPLQQPQPQYGQPYGYQPAPQQTYQAPTAYQQPAPQAPYSYQAPAASSPGVVQTPTQVYQQDPGSYSIVTVVASPEMEQRAKATNQISMSDGTSTLLGNLRGQVVAKDADKRTLTRLDNQTNVSPLTGDVIAISPVDGSRTVMRTDRNFGQVRMQAADVFTASTDQIPALTQTGVMRGPNAAPQQMGPQQMAPQQMAMAPAGSAGLMMDAAKPYGMSDALFRQAISAPSNNKAFAAIVFPPESIAVTTTAQGKIAEAVKKVTDQGGRVQVVASAPALAMNDSAALGVAMRRAMVIRNVLLNSGVPEGAVEIRAYLKQVQSTAQLQDKKQHRVSMVRM